MAKAQYTRLEDRGVIAVTGEDRTAFLQGIVSNDMNKLAPERSGYGAFLTPQGKYLFDFFMAIDGETLLIEGEAERLGDFIKRLSMYKLRAKVDLADASGRYAVHAAFGDGVAASLGLDETRGTSKQVDGGVAFVDPRLAAAGVRVLASPDKAKSLFAAADMEPADPAGYDRHRLSLGLPDASRDLVVDKATLMESGFDELGGIDWQKGCYMGQEVTARMKHRGLVKKRLMPVVIAGEAPEPGTDVTLDGRNVGEMRSASGDRGMALLKLDTLNADGDLEAGGAKLTPERPDWATF